MQVACKIPTLCMLLFSSLLIMILPDSGKYFVNNKCTSLIIISNQLPLLFQTLQLKFGMGKEL